VLSNCYWCIGHYLLCLAVLALDEKLVQIFYAVKKLNGGKSLVLFTKAPQMFCTPVSAEQMKEQSRIATEAAMREIAKGIACDANHTDLSDTPDELTSSTDSTYNHKRRRDSRKRIRSERSVDPSITRLETRNHYLQLEVANAMTVSHELKDKLDEATNRLESYTKVNNELALIRSAIERSCKGLEGLTIGQIEHKLKLFEEETMEHFTLCAIAINNIDLHEINSGLERLMASEQRRSMNHVNDLCDTIRYHKRVSLARDASLLFVGSFFFYLFVRFLACVIYWIYF
jgi:hypothetical protein